MTRSLSARSRGESIPPHLIPKQSSGPAENPEQRAASASASRQSRGSRSALERPVAPPAGRGAHSGPASGQEGEAGSGRHRPWATRGACGGGARLCPGAMAEGRSAVRSSVRALNSRLGCAEEPAEVAEARLLGPVRAASRIRAEKLGPALLCLKHPVWQVAVVLSGPFLAGDPKLSCGGAEFCVCKGFSQ